MLEECKGVSAHVYFNEYLCVCVSLSCNRSQGRNRDSPALAIRIGGWKEKRHKGKKELRYTLRGRIKSPVDMLALCVIKH